MKGMKLKRSVAAPNLHAGGLRSDMRQCDVGRTGARGVLGLALLDEGLLVGLGEVLELEVTRVPAGPALAACHTRSRVSVDDEPRRAAARTVVEEEEDGADDGDEVEGEREHVAEEAVERDALERAHERLADVAAAPAAAAEPAPALVDELGLALGAERGVEDLREGGAEEERAREDGEQEDGLGEDEDEGDERAEGAGEEGEEGGLREVGEEEEAAEDAGGDEEGLDDGGAGGGEDAGVCKGYGEREREKESGLGWTDWRGRRRCRGWARARRRR